MEKRFKTYEECEQAIGLAAGTLPDVSMLPEKYRKALINDFKLTVICEAHNDGWEPNFNDSSTPKYVMCPEIAASNEQPTGFGFSGSDCAYWHAHSHCGSRHLLKSAELAIYILNTFSEICKGHFLLK